MKVSAVLCPEFSDKYSIRNRQKKRKKKKSMHFQETKQATKPDSEMNPYVRTKIQKILNNYYIV